MPAPQGDERLLPKRGLAADEETLPVPNDDHYRKLEHMYLAGPINTFFTPAITVSEAKAEIVIPVKRDLFHAAQAVHGCAYFKMLDDAAYFAVSSLVEDRFILTVTFNLYLTRPITEGEMRSTGHVVHRSYRLYVAESVLVDSAGKQIGRGSGSFMVSSIPLTPEIGYA
jgi:uncharacterized protein (TIGR00369 family)